MKKLTPEGHEIINNYFKSLFEKIKDENEIKAENRKEKFLDLISSLNKISLDPEVDSNQIDWNSFAKAVIDFNSLPLLNDIQKNYPEFFKIINEKMGGNSAKDAALLGDLGF
jgi:transcriptional antiterminator